MYVFPVHRTSGPTENKTKQTGFGNTTLNSLRTDYHASLQDYRRIYDQMRPYNKSNGVDDDKIFIPPNVLKSFEMRILYEYITRASVSQSSAKL